MVSAGARSGPSELESRAWDAMRRWSLGLHVFYRIALLLPLLGLVLAAALKSGASTPDPALAYGGRSTSIYPPFLMRGLLAYGMVIVWVYRQLHRRPLREFETLLWQAPLTYIAVSAALLAALVLSHGLAAAFLDEHGGWMALRLAGDLTIGYGYVGLIVWARNLLQESGYFVPAVSREGRSDHWEPAPSTDRE